jgi:hypothetical protein
VHGVQTTPVLSMLRLVAEDPYAFVGGEVERREFNGYTMGTMANNLQLGIFDCGRKVDAGGTEGEGTHRDTARDLRVRLWQNEVERTFPGCASPSCPIGTVQALLSNLACSASEFAARCGGLTCKRPQKKSKKDTGKKKNLNKNLNRDSEKRGAAAKREHTGTPRPA